MIALFHPGTGFLHRIPAGPKLAALAVIALVLSLSDPSMSVIIAALLCASTLYPLARLPWLLLWRAWWRLRWLILVLSLALGILLTVEAAVVNTARIVVLILIADLVTRTTTMGELLELLQRILRPLRRLGIDPDAVALAISLTIAMVPVIAGFAGLARDAQRARGRRLGPRVLLPLLVMTMRHADDVGDSLVARGLAI